MRPTRQLRVDRRSSRDGRDCRFRRLGIACTGFGRTRRPTRLPGEHARRVPGTAMQDGPFGPIAAASSGEDRLRGPVSHGGLGQLECGDRYRSTQPRRIVGDARSARWTIRSMTDGGESRRFGDNHPIRVRLQTRHHPATCSGRRSSLSPGWFTGMPLSATVAVGRCKLWRIRFPGTTATRIRAVHHLTAPRGAWIVSVMTTEIPSSFVLLSSGPQFSVESHRVMPSPPRVTGVATTPRPALGPWSPWYARRSRGSMPQVGLA